MVLDWLLGSNNGGSRFNKALPFVRKFIDSNDDQRLNGGNRNDDRNTDNRNVENVSINQLDGVPANTADSLDPVYKASFNDGILEFRVPIPSSETLALCFGATTLAVSTFALRASSIKAAQYFRQKWGKPVLVRETSVISAYETIRHPITTLTNKKKKTELETFLKRLIFSPEVETKYNELVDDVCIRKNTKDSFRNLMTYGPPGNGRSLLAKKLALNAGMDYMLMSGTDLAPLGQGMATQMQEMFQRIQKHKKPILLIVDESEVFLEERDTEDFKEAVNVFFRNTSKPSNSLMLSLVANDPKNVNKEVHCRMDDFVNVTLPDQALREKLVQLFIKKHMAAEYNDGLPSDLISKVTSITDTMSCRDIEKLVMSWKSILVNSQDAVVRQEQILKCCQDAAVQQNIKNMLLERKKSATKSPVINTQQVQPKKEEVSSKNISSKVVKNAKDNFEYSTELKKF